MVRETGDYRRIVIEMQCCWLWIWRKDPWSKEYRQPLAAGKGKEKGSPLEHPSRKECSPADTLILAQWDLCWTPNLQNSKIISLYCFKPLSLWSSLATPVYKWPVNRAPLMLELKAIHGPETWALFHQYCCWSLTYQQQRPSLSPSYGTIPPGEHLMAN